VRVQPDNVQLGARLVLLAALHAGLLLAGLLLAGLLLAGLLLTALHAVLHAALGPVAPQGLWLYEPRPLCPSFPDFKTNS